MKKILIVFLFLFLLFGCSKGNTEVPVETEEDKILYETHMILRQNETVDLYDTIYVSHLDDLNTYQLKAHVFDPDLAESLALGTIGVRTQNASYNNDFNASRNLYVAHIFQSYVLDRTYVTGYKTTDFSSYLTETFLSDMQKLENGEITADDVFSTYGTHVIMSIRKGYRINLLLTIESRDIQTSDFEYIKNIYIVSRPITLPIKDETYLALEAKSRIILEVQTTHSDSNLEHVLNDLGTTNIPYVNMFEEDDIIPLFSLFGWDSNLYPNATQKLKTRYSELFPGAILY